MARDGETVLVRRPSRSTIGYALLFAIPSGIAATTAVDALLEARLQYAVLAGLTTAAAVTAFVFLLTVTGESTRERTA